MSVRRRYVKAGAPPPLPPYQSQLESAISELKLGKTFWEAVVNRFVFRELTRDDVREIIRRGLNETQGDYEVMINNYNLTPASYGSFMLFLLRYDLYVQV